MASARATGPEQPATLSDAGPVAQRKREAAYAAAEEVQDGMRLGLGTGSTVAFLLQAGKKPGALRTVTKTIRLAKRLANAGGAPMEVADLRDAFAQRYGDAA